MSPELPLATSSTPVAAGVADAPPTRIDLAKEQLIPLSQVPRLENLPRKGTGKRHHVATIYRWAQRGLKGTRLETIQAGGTLCTSIESLQRFFDRLTQHTNTRDVTTPAARQRQIDRASEQVEAIFAPEGR